MKLPSEGAGDAGLKPPAVDLRQWSRPSRCRCPFSAQALTARVHAAARGAHANRGPSRYTSSRGQVRSSMPRSSWWPVHTAQQCAEARLIASGAVRLGVSDGARRAIRVGVASPTKMNTVEAHTLPCARSFLDFKHFSRSVPKPLTAHEASLCHKY